jgi:hypothetical protein
MLLIAGFGIALTGAVIFILKYLSEVLIIDRITDTLLFFPFLCLITFKLLITCLQLDIEFKLILGVDRLVS